MDYAPQDGRDHRRSSLGVSRCWLGRNVPVFFFFSNRLGCLPSLILSLVVTAVMLLLLGVL